MKKINIERPKPDDADYLKDIEPVICYNPIKANEISQINDLVSDT